MPRTACVLFVLLFVGLHFELGGSQTELGEYPPISSVATYRPVTASSVCGATTAEDYCRYTTDSLASLAPNCIEDVCNNTCPHSSASPPFLSLPTLGTFGPGVSTAQGRPDSTAPALLFNASFVEIPAANVPLLGGRGFSFTAWIQQNEGNTGSLISKATADGLERNYVLTVNQSSLTLDYLPSTLDLSSLPLGAQRYRSARVDGLSLTPADWHHIAVTVYEEDAVFYVNGTVAVVQRLEGTMVDESRTVFLGQTFPSAGHYNGKMQEVYFYSQALTAREVTELVTGSLPFVHLSSECHCPPSHTLINLNDEASCVQQVGFTDRGSVRRINTLAHPAGFINDFGTQNGWISAAGEKEVNITVVLTDSLYELIFVNFRYGSPRPKAAVLETSQDGTTFRPIQYYADDCMLYFGLPSNGDIVNADDVNCITAESMQTPTFNADVRTRLLDQAVRPFDLNTSPELREFILSSHLRLRLVDFFVEGTTLPHRYYSILEITVAARCACNGHSSRCGSDIDSVCQCVHNTEGDRCERCLPLYNDKAWRYGTTTNGFPCRLCECNGHASRCQYNASLDLFPDSYEQGGGGRCDDCQDNTAGQFCESCRSGFFRPMGVQPDAPSPCEPCGCEPAGIADDGDCVKSEGIAGTVAGQCFCKENVMGLKCDTCSLGFFDLSADNPDGCSPCGCNTAGTFEASTNCNANTGQCICKANVEGLKCDQCRNGTTGLNALNFLGCSDCACNLTGSLSNNCDPVSGACPCQPGVGGTLCDQCLPGFNSFSDSGCLACACHPQGATSNVCDATTGECNCRENVVGASCDSCTEGFYNISARCVPCGCETAGTVGGADTCDMETGVCECKANVEGRECNTCSRGFTNLTASNPDGCAACDCFEPNTILSGNICDPVTSQCECLSSADGLRCDTCRSGFYLVPTGCVPCDCDPVGAVGGQCDPVSGQCVCSSAGVGGRRCDVCLPGFFQFPSCASCGCDPAGVVAGSECDSESGECRCKTFVTGTACDSCIPGFQMLEADNPFGCSAAPDELAPPTPTPLSSTSVLLTWLEPEAPNGVILGYRVYRNSFLIANTTATDYNDTGLTPFTIYSYFIEAFNVIGSTSSASISTQTLEGIPTGIDPPSLQAISADTVLASWSEPAVTNGIISRYELVLVSEGGTPTEQVVFSGPDLSSSVSPLRPFTVYSFRVRACTAGGCGYSEASQVQTLQAPPTFQPAPNVTTVNATALELTWAPPPEPNGILLQYEVYQRNAPFEGEGFLVGVVASNVMVLVVGGLQPFTSYEFRVVSSTDGGSTSSEWAAGETGEAVPEGVQPPTLTPLSSSAIRVNWTEPVRPNGVITRYGVYQTSLDGSQRTLLFISSEIGSYDAEGLQPFTEYAFLIEACTVEGCSESEPASETTLESAPSGQLAPEVTDQNATSISLQWEEPLQPNGIITNYILQRRRPGLSPAPSLRDVGVSFTGGGLATFPPGVANLGGFLNEISLRFRTFWGYGPLVYYINTARTDFIAIELRSGVPWFFFDAGSGSVGIRPETEVTFNDGEWHYVVVRQEGREGTITVDEIYTGSGQSPGTDQVISSNQVLYVGGIPSNVPHTTVTGTPDTTLLGGNFSGCLFGVTLNGELLDFSSSESSPGVDPPSLGCPIDLEPGATLLGGGYFALPENSITSSRFNYTFDVRTTDTRGLVLFIHNQNNASLAVEIRNSALQLAVVVGGARFEATITSVTVCDGLWHNLLLEQDGDLVSVSLDDIVQSVVLPTSDVVFSSSIFIGGVPRDSYARTLARSAGVDVYTPFSGCTRASLPALYVDGVPQFVRLYESEFVRFDGCGQSAAATCTAPWTGVDVGMRTAYTDGGLVPFTDYLYRVSAENLAGSVLSPWVAAMTAESVPSGVGTVTVVAQTESSLTVRWDPPSIPNGLVIQYDVIATPTSTVGLSSPLGGVAMATVDVVEPAMLLVATLTGLQPATNHALTLTAYTSAGGERGPSVTIATTESVPVGVQPPFVISNGSRSLDLSWPSPTQPNGVIIRYDLFVNGQLQFSGPGNSATVGGLEPFTEYTLLVQACTIVGCSNSSAVVVLTLPDSPTGLAAPNLTALSPSSIEAVWLPPANPNGIILRFELYMLSGEERELIFSGLDLETTITGLSPNTLYSFQLLAFNAGGFAESPVVQERTLEDIPDGISAPVIEVVNSTSLNISWEEPTQQNGIIIEYILTQNGVTVFSGLALSYLATELQPFTVYSYAVMACTVEGCGSSNHSSARTLEATPEGYVEPSIPSATSDTVTLIINPVSSPNGIVRYIVYVTGEFAVSSQRRRRRQGTVVESRVVYNSTEPGEVAVTDLLPFSTYEVSVTVTNSAGTLTGPPFTIQTDPTAPTGLAAPTLSLLDVTTLMVAWAPPSRPNGPLLYYEVSLTSTDHSLTLNTALNTSVIVSDLRPFTLYEVSVTVFNTEGSTQSPTVNITTGETAPSGFDQVVVLSRGSRHIVLSWDPPAAPNGVLVNYTILQGGVGVASVPPSDLEYNVSGLLPFSEYSFSVLACNAAGCTESPSVTTTTLEDVPEGVAAPFVTAGIAGSVLISWTAPSTPNGIILQYDVERAPGGSENFTSLGVVLGDAPLVFVDAATLPFTTYEYRIVAVNSAGSTAGPPTSFTTPETAPSGVQPPLLSALSSSSIEVRFRAPLSPNGIIISYTLTRSPPTSPPLTIPLNTSTLPTVNDYFVHIDTQLAPFTNYTYFLTVCTSGGCTDSARVWVVTLEDTPAGIIPPTATALNSSAISVSWQPPLQPNGVILPYNLLRRDLGFYNSTEGLSNCCEEYLAVQENNEAQLSDSCSLVVQTEPDVTEYTDVGLQAFSFYQYCVIVSNGAGSVYSNLSSPVRTDPAPSPLTGPELNATTINSTAIYLSWGSLEISELLGPLEGYTLYGKVAGTPGIGDILFTGLEQMYTATGLIASTEYIFVVAVSNGRGTALSNNATATTEEGIPANLSAPAVETVSSTSLAITWSEPLQPNGVIVIYTIFLDSVPVHNQSQPGTLVVEGLTPFTLYTVQVEACTQFGCTRSPLVAMTTLEDIPVGLGSPAVTITGPTSANVSWGEPFQPNGIILEYQLYISGELVFLGLGFEFTAENLLPFTVYSFEVFALNSVGNVSSGVSTAQTEEAPPSLVSPPNITVVLATEIALSWSQPEELNGILTGYQLYRNGFLLLTTLSTSHIDSSLEPFTSYLYILEACTNGGCTNSTPVLRTTLEAIPEMLADPVISSLTPRSLTITWEAPARPNGIITEFIVTLTSNNTVLFQGLALSLRLMDLTPFTNYSFQLQACNSVGCVSSSIVDVQTPEAPPEGLDAPRLQNLTSTSVAVEWSAPAVPNGFITTYILRRGNESSTETVVVFQGLGFSFNDMNLIADTLYSYTVEAVNGGGSVESAASYIRTVPDLPDPVLPPTLDVQGSTSIHVTWTAPARPNGAISRYVLYMNNVVVFSGIGFEYTAPGLTPFTVHEFYYEVCNQAGCARSITVTAVTEEAPPEGVSPPVLSVLGPTAIEVSWQPPSMPNGIITRYEVRRRILGSPETELPQHSGGPAQLSFPNSGLDPFTTYEYRLRVSNNAGSTFSEWVAATTDEDIPEGISLPDFADSDIFARNVTATWDPPTRPNGIILSYRLEYRLPFDPATNMPGTPVVAAAVPANTTMASATGLTPVTVYEFRVIAINSAGEGEGEWQTVTTREDVPEGIQAIIVEARAGDSLTLSWSPPLTPNGVIQEYMLFLDGELVYRDSPPMYIVTRLEPFTSYTLQLAACTLAGCTSGEAQSITTAEIPPFGQPAPLLSARSPRTVEVTWDEPAQPNGIITRYDILRQNDAIPSTLVVLGSTNSSMRSFIDETVLPFSPYQYAIRVVNSVGQVESDFSAITTPEAAPEGLTAPQLTALTSFSIRVVWDAPLQENGVITQYQAFRTGGGGTNESVYVGQNREFEDVDLQPFTLYTYAIQACTSGGCSLSPTASTTTLEALPEDFAAPLLSALSSTEISIQWAPPDKPNGVITSYVVRILSTPIQVTTTELAVNITNLQPFTLYTVTVDACNSVGCVTSVGQVRTSEDTPGFIAPPQLTALDSTAIQVTWQEPTLPNGVITQYTLRRNGTIIFTQNATTFTDTGLVPNQFYSYTVQAFTAVGAGDESPPRSIQTLPDTPEDIFPPELVVDGANAIDVSWREPGQPNGVIQRYVLTLNGVEILNSTRAEVEQLGFRLRVDGLSPHTEYTFQLTVCTTTCGSSPTVTARTDQAPPSGLAPPQLAAPTSTSVNIAWDSPEEPNGVILTFVLERRQVFADSSTSDFEAVFSGLATSYLDQAAALRPAMTYQYRVTAFNSAGSVTSNTSEVTLPEAAPEGVVQPAIQDITSSSLTAVVAPPAVPNGQLTEYRLYLNGSLVNVMVPASQTSPVVFLVELLQPYTVYEYHAEVCTRASCNTSDVVTARTAEAPPEGQAAPMGVPTSARSVRIDWAPPSQPNGVILSYTLRYAYPCPQPPRFFDPPPVCEETPLTVIYTGTELSYVFTGSDSNDPRPYSSYQFQVEAQNSAGTTISPLSGIVTTIESAPQANPNTVVFAVDQQILTVFLDWSATFELNGRLRQFEVRRNSFQLLQTNRLNITLTTEPTGALEYVITAQTFVGEVSSEPITVMLGTTTPSTSTPTNATTSTGDSKEVYEEAAFIAGMVVIAIALIFVLCGLLLCFIRPRGDSSYKVVDQLRLESSPVRAGYQHMTPLEGSPARSGYRHHEPVTGSWSPGQATWEVPESVDEEIGTVIIPTATKSYSPKKMETAALLAEHDQTLPDTHISGYNPRQFVPASEDFGSYKAQHTTFQDTKV